MISGWCGGVCGANRTHECSWTLWLYRTKWRYFCSWYFHHCHSSLLTLVP
jgi:hypothetical protein